ncbi:MAG: thioredoxin [Candidatus Orphnella occulta]|nr:thioredoxin [Candidatus Orphnella occulta]
MPENIFEINEVNFKSEVKDVSGPCLVDFWAPWCGPCQMIAPALESIANAQQGKLKVCKVNIDDNQKLAAELGVMSIPTLVLFKDGNEQERIVGALGEAELTKRIEKYLV